MVSNYASQIIIFTQWPQMPVSTQNFDSSFESEDGTYNFDFHLIKSIMEPLIGSSDNISDMPPWKPSMFRVVAFRFTQDLACLQKLYRVSSG